MQSGLDHFLRFGQFEGRFPGIDDSPCLTMCPVVRWSSRKRYLTGRHGLQGARFNTPYEFGAAVLHFKMLDDFPIKSAEEALRGEHWQEAAEYKRYAAAFAAQPALSAHFAGSARYAGSHQLIGLGYMREAFLPPNAREADGRGGRWLRRLGQPT